MIKNVILSIIFFSISVVTFSQQNEPTQQLTKQDYLRKSKRQKTVGYVCIGITATCAAIVATRNASEEVLQVVVISGLASAITSIPFFIASCKNKRNAVSLSFNIKQSQRLQKNIIANKQIPSLTIKLNL